MKFSDSTTEDAVIQEINRICGATDNTYSLKAKTARVNAALDRYYTLAFEADARWAYDDLNQTSPPLESVNLVSGTQKYAIDAFTSEILNVLRVEALDSSGNKILLNPLQDNQIGDQAFTAFMSTNGTPTWYRKFAKWIYLYPAPNYSSANGLSLYFERPATRMASTDTTKVPGAASIHHPYLCRYASLPFLIEKKLPQAQSVAQQIQIDEEAITNYFSRRDKDAPTKLMMTVHSSR